jgi:hypothetical protein
VFVFLDLVLSCFRFLHGAFSSDLGFFRSPPPPLFFSPEISFLLQLQISSWCILFRLRFLFPSPPLFCSVEFPFWWWIWFSLASPCFSFLPCAFSHLGSFFQSPPPFLQSGIFILHSVLTRSAWLWRRRIDYALSVCSRSLIVFIFNPAWLFLALPYKLLFCLFLCVVSLNWKQPTFRVRAILKLSLVQLQSWC